MPYGRQIMVTGKGSKTRGFNPSYGLHALRASVIADRWPGTGASFNPSYGLHALRALLHPAPKTLLLHVSIPHMGCMPYGPSHIVVSYLFREVSIPHMGCMPYGLPRHQSHNW